jgi:hypothetical protein
VHSRHLEGISKYDGYKFTNYNTTNGLSFDLVNDVYEDENKKIYVAQNNGRVDVITDNKVSSPLTDSIVINKFVKSGTTVYAITDDHGIGISKM